MPLHTIKNCIKTLIPNTLLMHRLPAAANDTILLTFDDGPDEKITPMILEQLETYQVKAVFFVIGEKVEALPDIFKMITQKGHIVGNHTYSHPYHKIPGFNKYHEEIRCCQMIIENNIQPPPTLYRPPAGTISISGLMLTKRLHLKTILWSIEGGEWGINKKDDAQTISQRLIKDLKPRDILLLHDDNEKTPAILNTVLPELKKRRIDLFNGAGLLCH